MRLSRLGILGVAIVVFSPFVGSAQNMPVSAASTCVSITQNLSFGSRGSDVIQLQQYLISQGLLAADSATGYFGKLTEAAVQQWQSSHGLVSSGTVATTGYGAVGPKTRAAIAASTCSTTSPTASSGTAGQAANPIQSAIDALLAQIHVLQDQINRLTSANTNTNPVTNTGTNSNTVSFSATPSSGTAPLTVSFQGNGGGRSYFGGARIDFGDGTSAVFCNQGSFCGSNIASHTYNTAGTYMATLTGVGEGNNVALGSVRINASASDISTTVASCTFNGATIAHGSSVTAYQSSSDHLMCRSQTRTCNSGTLSGSYTYSSCTVLPPSTHTCTFNGATIAHGASVTAYQSATVPSGSACSPQTRTCTNGTLSGSYAYSSCTVLPPRCTFNDNPIASGSSVTAYQSSTAPYGSSCRSQTRTCTNGTLSGSYAYSSCTVSPAPISYSSPIKLIDAPTFGYTYGYAPSIISVNGTWYMYYCSGNANTGPSSLPPQDYMRYSTSVDGINWSGPSVILSPGDEFDTCDPSVVYYNAGDGYYFYMFYSGAYLPWTSPAHTAIQWGGLAPVTTNHVARSTWPNGPFLKLTNRNTWEANPPDPKIIVRADHDTPVWYGSGYYGAGEPTVVVKDNLLYMWFNDDTAQYPSNQISTLYLSISADPKNWPTRVATNRHDSGSVDIKYDPVSNKFVMYDITADLSGHENVTTKTSDDGITWTNPQTVIPDSGLPNFAHNPGVTGSHMGWLMPSLTEVIYAAPHGLINEKSQEHGDLYGQSLIGGY